MRAMIVGAGMGGLSAALAMRQSERFEAIDVYEQTREPSTAGAGLNVAPNGARICQWLGVDLDGGDPKGPHGAVDGGRAAILPFTRQVLPGGTVSVRPLDHDTKAGDGAGYHHMHRLDLLMALYQRVFEFAPHTGARCPITVHMGKKITAVEQDPATVTARFADGTAATGAVLVGADGVNSQVLKLCWPDAKPRRWTGVSCISRPDPARQGGRPCASPTGRKWDNNPIDAFTMDVIKNDHTFCMTYWVRGGELLNVWMAYFDPEGVDFQADDWFPIDHADMIANLEKGFGDDARKADGPGHGHGDGRPDQMGPLRPRRVRALDGWPHLPARRRPPTRCCPPSGQGASQTFEDSAALGQCFALHGDDVFTALLHYERVRPLSRHALPVHVEIPVQAYGTKGFRRAANADEGAQRA